MDFRGDPKKKFCRYFGKGFCGRGSKCPFSHDRNMNPVICKYFLAGTCSYGDSCRYAHPEPKKVPQKSKQPSFSSGDFEDITFVETSIVCDCPCRGWRSDIPKQHLRPQVQLSTEQKKELQLAKQHENKICGICIENVWKLGKSFGILPNCDHCYCLDCISTWRSNKDSSFSKPVAHGCPQCRAESDFVVPSKFWIEGEKEKDKLIAEYRASCKRIRCENELSYRRCPLGSRCLFKHELSDGRSARQEFGSRTSRRRVGFDFVDSDMEDDFDLEGQLEALQMFKMLWERRNRD